MNQYVAIFIRCAVGTDPDLFPDDLSVQAAVGEYFRYLNEYFYTCDLAFLRGLADGWVVDPRFAQNYERIREGGAEFVRAAVHVYCDRDGWRGNRRTPNKAA